MKKLFLLTSILALAACGGGGGGGGGADTPAARPPRAAITDDAITSNSNITSMSSEVLVPKSGSGEIIARAGSVNWEGQTYTSYRLDDVDFRIATSAGENPTLRFKMDKDGRIDSLVMKMGGEEQHMFRNGETSDFRGIVYEYIELEDGTGDVALRRDRNTIHRLVYSPDKDPETFAQLHTDSKGKDACPDGKTCRWDRIDQAFRITSNGGTDNLTYSDFGNLYTTNFGKYKGITDEDSFADAKIHTRETSGGELVEGGSYATWDTVGIFDNQDYDVFAGGYKVNALQHRPTEDMTFKGKAVGSIYATNSGNHHDASRALVDPEATLTFDAEHGTETLAMAFDNWYDVTVTKTGSTNRIRFDNFNGVAEDDGNAFRSATDGVLVVDNFNVTSGKADVVGDVKKEGMLDMGYYGKTGPEEATGVIRFKETSVENREIDEQIKKVDYEREFRAGYGMKPVEP